MAPPVSRRPVCASRLVRRELVLLLLQAAGLGSHNRCTQLLVAGRVALNGRLLTDLQARADPTVDTLQVDGRPLRPLRWCQYVVIYKPYNVMSCFTDAEGHATLAQYLAMPEIYAAGRLDYDSEGLLLLTSDNWLLHRLTEPQYEHPKTYLVQVEGIPDEAALAQLRAGVLVKGERTRPADAELLPAEPVVPPRDPPIRYRASIPTSWLRVVLREGRKRQLRHMTAAVGHPTLRLIRTQVGPIALGDLQPGQWRELSPAELGALADALH
ncbi:MAG: pseudouridine synthase [Chloroflexi bacterium]|nr:pseudouridine synthase [Chloroflexota bacterium]